MPDRTLKTRIATLGATAVVFYIFAAYSFVSFNQRLHYAATTAYAAQAPLEWIQSAQGLCIQQTGLPCPTLEALLDTDPEANNDGRARVARQFEAPYTTQSGRSGYKYTIHTVTADDFEARATHHSGEDVWRIGRTGPATALRQTETRDGFRYERLTAILTIGLLLTYFGLLIEMALFHWRRAPTRTRAFVNSGLVFGVGTIALPLGGGLMATVIPTLIGLLFE